MNIVFVVDIVLSGRGGMETALSLIHDELKRRHHIVILLKGRSADESWEEGMVTVPLFHKINNLLPPKYMLSMYAAALSNAMKSLLPIDIIISTGSTGVAAAKMATERLNIRVPVVSWLHFNLDFYVKGFDDLQAADGHLAISEGNLRDMHCVFPTKINKLVYNPVRYDDVSYVARPDTPLFLYMGRLAKVKRVNHIMQALSPLQDHPWELHIIGDGEEYESLLNLAEQLGIHNRVVWHGWRQSPWDVVTRATSLLLASDTEPFGLVMTEALARGIPVISSNCNYGPREIVNQSNGWLYPSNDLEELTLILRRVMNGEYRLPSPESCRESVRAFAVETIAERYEQALEAIKAGAEASMRELQEQHRVICSQNVQKIVD
ncbi:glycosyltransferase [Paenibacillus sp. SYP-B4298]|uniref:glycosyltransferase n=1 Tax=Paenibacillus sp. SYP-B4298 TaxID=2996034 RepID=UPI0022DD4AAB|nr:glycosyltransferase [Paenibacillus sp. SYP-B4298]